MTDGGTTEGLAHILIVDDVEDNRALLSRRLTREGYTVSEAEDGLAATQKLGDEHFDMVLLDIMMPEMDGFQVLKAVRERYDEVSLPIIMVTAKTESQDVVDAFELGANDYITKPVDMDVAMARIKLHLRIAQSEKLGEA